MVAADVRRRIWAQKHFRLVTSAATALATILERVLHQIPLKLFSRQSFLENALQNG